MGRPRPPTRKPRRVIPVTPVVPVFRVVRATTVMLRSEADSCCLRFSNSHAGDSDAGSLLPGRESGRHREMRITHTIMSPIEEDLIQQLQLQQAREEEERARKRSSFSFGKAGGGGVLLLLAWKFKALLLLALAKAKVLLLGFKFLGTGKLFVSGGSMVASVVLYATQWGFPYALGFVLLIFVHEMGHVLALRRRRIAGTVPIFVPFVGAFIALKEMPKNVQVEAEVGIAGPLLGSVGAFLCYGIFSVSHQPLFLSLAYAGFFINLFNLLPVLPLDGGRVVAAISPRIWIAGLALCLPFLIMRPNIVLLALIGLSLPRFFSSWKQSPEMSDYYRMTKGARLAISLLYFGLAAVLGALMVDSHQTLRALLTAGINN